MIAAGTQGLALKSDGTVLSWGSNSVGQVGDGTTTDRVTPVQVSGLGPGSGATQITASGWQGAALKTGGTIVTWGFNFYGELGNGTTGGGPCSCGTAPTTVVGTSGATQVVAGGAHYLGLQPNPGAVSGGGSAPVSGPLPPPAAAAASVAATARPANLLVSPSDPLPFGIPHLASNPSHPGQLAIAYTPPIGNPCSLATSTDDGATWASEAVVPGLLAFPASSDSSISFDTCQTPSVAYGPDGTMYYAFVANQSFSSGEVFLTASVDGGRTFLPPQQVDVGARPPTDPSGGDNAFEPLVATDQTQGGGRGNVYVAYGEFQPANNFTFGQERAVACSAAELSAYVGGAGLRCHDPVQLSASRTRHILTDNPVVAPDGRVYIAWTDDDETGPSGDFGGPVNFNVASSSDAGLTFTPPVTADRLASICPGFTCPGPAGGAASSIFDFATLAAGSSAGELYLAVSGPRGEHSRVTFSVSHDGGQTWTSRQEVGVISGHETDEQHSPGLAVAPGGRVDLAYYDTNPAGVQNVFLTSSTDGGESFGAPRQISDASSDENVLGPNTADISVGLLATDSGFAIAWADSRRGSLDTGKSDIAFATNLSLSGPSASGPGVFPVPVPATGASLVTPAEAGAALMVGVLPLGLLLGGGAILRRRDRNETAVRKRRDHRRRR